MKKGVIRKVNLKRPYDLGQPAAPQKMHRVVRPMLSVANPLCVNRSITFPQLARITLYVFFGPISSFDEKMEKATNKSKRYRERWFFRHSGYFFEEHRGIKNTCQAKQLNPSVGA